MDEQIFYYLTAVALLVITAQWLAWRFNLPSILLLLAFCVGLGQLTSPGEEPIPRDLLFPIVSLSVAVILFEGGLSLRLSELKQAGEVVLRLCTLGALVTWVLSAAAAFWILGFDISIAALIGAILIVTGPTVIAPLLRHIRPVRRVGSIVKWEGIVIDPIGAVLAVLVFEAVLAGGLGAAAGATVISLVRTVVVGGVAGTAAAWLLIAMLKRYWIPDFLHSPVFLATAIGAFTLSHHLQDESGLVTVTVMGVMLANQKAFPVKHVIEFKENLQVLLISFLFIVLGSRIDLYDIQALGWRGLGFLAVLILFIRPASIITATVGSGLSFAERLFLCFIAPRGIVAAAVTSVFALKLLQEPAIPEALLEQAEQLVPLTFLVIVGTVTVYGLFAAPLARRLKLADPKPQGIVFAGGEPWVRETAALLQKEGCPVVVIDKNYSHVAAARMEGLTAYCASILAEYVHEEIDLNGMGRMLAVTPNDEVNALAVREFAHLFSRANVYQLPPSGMEAGPRASVSEHLRGRLLFHPGLDHDEIMRRLDEGAQIKKTQLTQEFTFGQFLDLYGEAVVVMFVIDEWRKLHVSTADRPITPQPNQTVIAFVPAPGRRA